MIYGSICSGIEAATQAWHPLGWKPAFFSEIDKFPRAVLQYRHPAVACHGDFTTIGEHDYGSIDLLVGGTPCQDYSIAGLCEGITGDEGRLTLEFVRLLERKKPRWFLWENVCGVLSSDGGGGLAQFFGSLAKCGYGFAYRVLDAQYFGIAQCRRRVFVVGYLGDWRPPAAVLFEEGTLRGDFSARKRKRTVIASTVDRGAEAAIHPISEMIAMRAPTDPRQGMGIGNAGDPAYTITKSHQHAVAIQGNIIGKTDDKFKNGSGFSDTMFTLNTSREHALAIVGNLIGRSAAAGPNGTGVSDKMFCLTKTDRHAVQQDFVARYITPLEAERLMGFPDNHTLIPWGNDLAPDTLRYEAVGNSMSVPVIRWLGERIDMVDKLL